MEIKLIIKRVTVAALLVAVAMLFFYPLLQGKELYQSDIAQFRGMSKQVNDFRTSEGTEPYWTDAAFGGMPTYQLSTYYPNDILKSLDGIIRFLPTPADYLFLYFVSFFVLLLVLKVDWKMATLGSIAFGFITYLIIIIGVGHNAKVHAIGYMPLVLAGLILLFEKKWFVGFMVTTLAMALEIKTSHPQMTYYLLFLLFFVGLFYVVDAFKNKKIATTYQPISLLVGSIVIAVLMNAVSLLPTKEYTNQSTRGKSDLTITANGTIKTKTQGLDKKYITEYSYGIFETFNLMIPRLTGGANNENVGSNSKTFEFLSANVGGQQADEFAKNAPTYWGDQPMVAAPAYIGVGFVFLFVVGLFLLDGWLKNGLVAATIFSIVLSWGKNFSLVTDFFIDYVPLYNKFRAVSSIQVIAEIAIPLMSMLTLQKLLTTTVSKEDKLKSLTQAFYVVAGIIISLTFVGAMLYSFNGVNDAAYNQMLPGFSDALIADRKSMLISDGIRSLLIITTIVGVLWYFMKDKLSKNNAVLIVGLVLILDTFSVAKKYVNSDQFKSAKEINHPFEKSEIDQLILQDKSHYRVANFAGDFMNDGATSYYHKSIGGYHAAKLGRYQELVDFHILKNNLQVLNMLNTKYFILPSQDQKGNQLHVNDQANGNAWLVTNINKVSNANQEIKALSTFDSKITAVLNQKEFKGVKVGNGIGGIVLKSYAPNALSYEFKSASSQLAVFSEIYYQPGWNAYIDGKLVPHIRVNYVLRALEVPAGNHAIQFKFEPTVIKQGSVLSFTGYGLFVLVAGLIFWKQKNKE